MPFDAALDAARGPTPVGRGRLRGRKRAKEAGMIEAYSTGAALAEAAARAVSSQLAAGLTSRGFAGLVATGGRSPGPIYDLLSETALDWSRVSVTLSDERCVGDDHPDSNARLVRGRLLRPPPRGRTSCLCGRRPTRPRSRRSCPSTR